MTAGRATVGTILIVLGLIFLLDSLDVMDFGEMMAYLIPLGFIGLGIWLIVRQKKKDDAVHFAAPPPPPGGDQPEPGRSESTASWQEAEPVGPAGASSSSYQYSTAAPVYEDGKLRYSKLFGDLTIDLRGRKIQNVEVSIGAGDLELRLPGAELEGGLCRLIVSCFLGDVRIFLPAGMEAYAHCSSFIGDIDMFGRMTSGFGNNLDAQTAGYSGAESRLYIAVSNFIGDIKIYHV